MSKETNRAKLEKALTDRERKISERVSKSYCLICNRRSGSHHYDCSPSNLGSKGRHGSGKPILPYKFRSFKTWKHNRNTQYKLTIKLRNYE